MRDILALIFYSHFQVFIRVTVPERTLGKRVALLYVISASLHCTGVGDCVEGTGAVV
jgi:hypothetical protein